MKTKQNTWFWILQLLGWGILIGIQVFTKLSFAKELSNTYIIVEGLLVLISGIFISTALRFYLKKNIEFGSQTKNYIKSFVAFVIASLLFTSMMFVAAPIYEYYHEKPLEINKLFIISQLLNSFLFFFFWVVLYFGIKLVFKNNQNNVERLKLKTSLKESQLNTLKGQINPHFMFNSLNNIRGLMLEDVDKSREMITRLSDMLRYSLTKNNINKIAISEELEMVENYIELSKIQLEDRLTFQTEIDKTLVNKEIPPMIIQILIENAIKHGISNLSKGGVVRLKIQKEDQNLIIKVCNTGKLTLNKTTTKVGLENIKKRLTLLYGNKANFSLSEIGSEVIASIEIPF